MVKIIDGYAFDHDNYCYTLYHVGQREKGVFGSTEKKSGEMVDYKDIIGYFGTLDSMCIALLNYETKRSAESAGVKTLGDYIEVMKSVADEIKKAVNVTAF